MMGFFSSQEKPQPIEVQTFFPPADRIIAIGDVHGDVHALKGCLSIAGLIDQHDQWTGRETTLVQLGDILDRGDDEKSCIDLLFALQEQARRVGGNVHVLLGNHELMNTDLDFRYVTRGAWSGWGAAVSARLGQALLLLGRPAHQHERTLAFLPGGAMAQQLARMPVAIRIGDALFAHGGVRLGHVRYGLERLNGETAAWLAAKGAEKVPKPALLDEDDSPLWLRQYSVPSPKEAAERELENVLRTLNAQRMVVGHTPQVLVAAGSARG
jgi:hypothetical protein